MQCSGKHTVIFNQERSGMSQVSQGSEVKLRSEVRDGMRIDWDVPIPAWTMASFSGRIFSAPLRMESIRNPNLRNLRQGSLLPGRLSRCSGRRWSPIIRRSLKARPTSIRTGRSPIRSGGYRTATCSPRGFARRRLVPGVHGSCPDGKSTIFTSASNGRVRSRGAMAR